LINSFRYPRKGPGMMWEVCAEKTKAMGGNIEMGHKVVGLDYDAPNESWTVSLQDRQGNVQTLQAEHVISSAPMRELVRGIRPEVSDEAKRAADSLKYRDFITVMLIVKNRDAFDDNWIYIHDPKVKVGRVQNFRSWSPEMVPDPDKACYTVVRQKKAYPVYDDDYAKHVETVRQELETRYPNLHLVGRNGMHKYNNQDHAMMTAMLCVENILADSKLYDLWEVNQDAEYHEAGAAGEEQQASGTALRMVPKRVRTTPELAAEAEG
jgi:protoporphyrinogen oxidase